jgi:hypothetical protein
MHRLVKLSTIAAALLPLFAQAATHYVRPGSTGANTGADWANAYTTLPTKLVRGDTYYLADGSYGAHVFNDAASGTSQIAIVKATPASHGTATGWSDTYGAGQATFTNWQIYTSYYRFDGQRRNADWWAGATSQYGLRVAGSSPVRLDNGAGSGANNLYFRYVDFKGGGRDTGDGDDVIYGLTGNSNLTFQDCALHDSDRTIFLMRDNWQNLVVDHSYLARNTSTPATHGEMLSMTDSTNVTWSNNVMEDIEGTAFIAGLNGGTATNWRIFGNVAFHSAAYIADTGRKAGHNFGVAGFVFIANDASNNNQGNNFLVYNNTIANVQGTWSGVIIQSGSGNDVRNNIWYASTRTNNSFTGNLSNNWYYQTLQDGDSSTSKTVCTTNCNVFVNVAAKNFRLTSSIGGGVALAAPYTVDSDGVTRAVDGSWDRGAYDYFGSALSKVTAPLFLLAN